MDAVTRSKRKIRFANVSILSTLAIFFLSAAELALAQSSSDYSILHGEERRALRYSDVPEASIAGRVDVVLSVYFRVASSSLDDEDRASIARLVRVWEDKCSSVVVLESFTDIRGSGSTNLQLARARGEAVAESLKMSSAAAVKSPFIGRSGDRPWSEPTCLPRMGFEVPS
jgi:outer membrane protein OmpA-like peptidoglycan-associated protein